MTMPLVISCPHAGTEIPPSLQPLYAVSQEDVVADGDVGAAEIYDFADEVASYVTTPIARVVVDMNRAEDDRRADGIVKTHTCWNVPVYKSPLPEETARLLIETYYRPYHDALSAAPPGNRLGVDCHTMAAEGPPIGPDPGKTRPWVCLSNGHDTTCSAETMASLAECFAESFGREIAINDPFVGGFIVRRHAAEMEWVQLELSRAPFMPNAEKRRRVLDALRKWCSLPR